jgi:hypothetical protein
MGGSAKIILVEENKAPKALITYTGSENEFFFSENYLKGNIKKALNNFIKASKEYHQHSYSKNQPLSFAPYHYGLNTINFKTKKIYSMNGYDIAGLKNLGFFLSLDRNNFKSLIQNKLADLYFKNTNQRINIFDFLGTDDPEKGFELLYCLQSPIPAELIAKREKSDGLIKNFAHEYFDASHEYFLLPHNFDFEVIEFDDENADDYFFALLNDGIDFSKEDIQDWYSYLTHHEEFDAIKKIEDYFIIKEKEKLENTVNISQIKETKKVKV